MINKVCEICGNIYKVRKYREKTSRFCSKACQGKYLQETFLLNRDTSYLLGNKFRQGKIPSNSFKEGHIPWNKGIKGLHLSVDTEFKKGKVSYNKKLIGDIVIRHKKNKDKKDRRYIKIADPNKWELYAVYLIKQAGIKIPKGSVVHHINGNQLDDRLDNLIVLSRADHINIHRQDLSKH